ncbi:hypothetical protein [Streptomyces sp. NPDC052496]|uniref:hypothetical protein n=1 Tax=Streptomyces sp. NPDC052496 TaxID=3154951 RepID=UPI003412ADEB
MTRPTSHGPPGRPRLKGERLGVVADMAAQAVFRTARADRYQRREQILLAEIHCLWYGSFHTRPVRVLLIRGSDPDTNKPLLSLVTTDLTTPAEQLVTRYAWRWSIEVTFAVAREHLGAGQAQGRVRHAVERTLPFAMYSYTITVLWYVLHGHHPDAAAESRRRSPWYVTKTQPSFADMTAKLRRVIIAARISALDPAQPTDDEIRAVQHAWAAAGTNDTE